MKIYFNGAAQTVTGAQFLIETKGGSFLLDCGLYQGKRQETYDRNRNFNFPIKKLDAVLLSHAHIDHSGNLPNLIKNGYNGPIFATPPTSALVDVMLRDSGHVQESDAEFINKKKAKRGEPLVEPLYTIEDAERVVDYIEPQPYVKTFEPVPGVTAHFVDAGHILGSASIVLEVEEDHHVTKFWFSGDIGRKHLPLIPDPVLPQDVDYLMMECTYGDKPHRDPQEAYVEFRDVVKRTITRGGKVIIPSFAVGRTQELVYFLNEMYTKKELKPVPVFVDSPLAVAASKIFQEYPEYFDEETREFVMTGRHPALNFDQLTYIQSVDESKALNERKDPMIIISASGMAETGRILHHLKNNIENPRNTVVIVSWQAPDTLGRRLADRERFVKIFGEEYECKAEIATIGGLSAHAGQDVLLDYARGVNGRAKKIILVHGEPSVEAVLKEKMDQNKIGPVVYPSLHDSMELC